LPVRLDTLYGCDTLYGNNAIKTPYYYPTLTGDANTYHFNPCMHVNAGGTHRAASVSAYKDLLSTNIAPYRALDTVPNYNAIDEYGWYLHAGRRAHWAAPKVVKRYATKTNPVWSYFTPETAGTDKYGFSILPAGQKYNGGYMGFLGEEAVFFTGSIKQVISSTANPGGISGVDICFQYNALLNPVMPYSISMSSFNYSGVSGSVRCVARKIN
jgi:hypothetical protein